MLNEKDIDKMLQPIVDEQENASFWVIMLIIERLKEIGTIPTSEINSLKYLAKTQKDIKLIKKELARIARKQMFNIQNFIKAIALDSYLDTKRYFEAKGLKFPAFSTNKQVQNVINQVTGNTLNAYDRMIRTQAFMIRDPRDMKVLKPTKPSEAYQSVVHEAARKVLDNTVDYSTALRRTTKQLVSSGLKEVVYESESGKVWTQRTDVALRRNMLDSVRAVNQGIQDEVGKQFGADGKEITVHEASAPDHEPIQGHQFSNEEFEKLQTEQDFQDYQGRKFSAIRRPIGMWNCRHFTFSIVLGVNPPIYSDEELEKLKERNKAGYTDKNGKHHTKYECTQIQRDLESKVKRAKEQQIAARELGDTTEAKKWQQEVNKLTKEYTDFSKASGLQPLPSKMSVSGYRKISTK